MHTWTVEDGPLVLFMHGWPESWFSWRHQLKVMGAAGYHAVAPDMRGYGSTSAPVDKYEYNVSMGLYGIIT